MYFLWNSIFQNSAIKIADQKQPLYCSTIVTKLRVSSKHFSKLPGEQINASHFNTWINWNELKIKIEGVIIMTDCIFWDLLCQTLLNASYFNAWINWNELKIKIEEVIIMTDCIILRSSLPNLEKVYSGDTLQGLLLLCMYKRVMNKKHEVNMT